MLDASLTVRANIYFGNEDEEAVLLSDTALYLLDKSLVSILEESGFTPESADGTKERSTKAADYLQATAAAFSSEDAESAIIRLAISKEILKHQLFVTKTDNRGQAQIKSLKTGTYYLFAFGRTEDEMLLWHLPVSVKTGDNTIELDQHNAEIIESVDD